MFLLDYQESSRTITVELPPDWVDVSEEISVNIQRARGLTLLIGTIVDRFDNSIHNVSSTVEDGTQTAAKGKPKIV
ncbi:hypothetical protein YC2023_029739 [Brassica napus]